MEVHVKSLKSFRESKGKEWKSRVTKAPESGNNEKKKEDSDVVLNIGLMEWSETEQNLRPKRRKKLVLRVSPTVSYCSLLELAEAKWKKFHSNLYQPNQTYVLLYEDGKKAILLPGSNDECFSLKHYHEEVGKDYKRITLFLCSGCDFDKSDADLGSTSSTSNITQSSEQKSPSTEDHEQIAKHQRLDLTEDHIDLTTDLITVQQIVADEELACEMQKTFDDEQLNESNKQFTDTSSLISQISEAVDKSDQSFIVVRRGAPLARTLTIWKREMNKNPSCLNRVLRVHYSGEQGIDSGAMAKEFYTKTVSDIGHTMFPTGSPVDSTSNIQNGSFVSCGEIVASSLAQGGPAPNFLHESVFNLMVNPDVDMKELDPDKHLTPDDRSYLTSIRNDVSMHQEAIIDHGYTGLIDEAHLEEIINSVVISIVMKRVVYLKEFTKGLAAFGLGNAIKTNPEVCKSLFVTESQGNDAVDANYLFSLLVPQYFQDFLFKLEDAEHVSNYVEAIACYEDGAVDTPQETVDQFNQPELTPAGVMGWLTGQKHKPLNEEAFTITVSFNHECRIEYPNHTVCFPVVGACAKSITLPVVHMTTSDQFNDIFLLAYCKGQSFAKA